MDWLTKQFELSRAGEPTIRPMEGLRGCAVLLVFMVHYVTAIEPWLTPDSVTMMLANALHTLGNTGVDLFFVLSGYLIYGSLMVHAQPLSRFLRRRAGRIYPAFSAVFLLYLALSYALPAENKIPPGTAAGALYLAQNFCLLSGFTEAPPMISVAWSLSYEMLYYLTIPWLIAVCHLRARSALWRLRFFTLLLAGLAAGFTAWGGPLRLLMFIAGIFLYEARAGAGAVPRLHAPGPGTTMTLLLLGMAGMLTSALPLLKIGALGGAFFVLCLACFEQTHSWLARAVSRTPLRWLGNMSYSYYLLHGLVLKAGFLMLAALSPPAQGPHGALFFCALLAPMLALTLPPAAALFLLVERPLSLAPARPINLARSSAENSRP